MKVLSEKQKCQVGYGKFNFGLEIKIWLIQQNECGLKWQGNLSTIWPNFWKDCVWIQNCQNGRSRHSLRPEGAENMPFGSQVPDLSFKTQIT